MSTPTIDPFTAPCFHSSWEFTGERQHDGYLIKNRRCTNCHEPLEPGRVRVTDATPGQSADTDARAGLVGMLLAHAVTPTERTSITRTALRAGFLWRCHPCRQEHLATTEACGCGEPRPAHLG